MTHSSILAWRIPWTEEPGRLQSIGLQRVGPCGSDLALTYASILFFFLFFSIMVYLRRLDIILFAIQ